MNLGEKLIGGIQSIARRYPVNKVVLFGSRARGDHKARSNIDLAVFPAPEFHSAGHFGSDIDDLETLLKIDMVLIDSQTDTALLERINREGVTLYERPADETGQFSESDGPAEPRDREAGCIG